MDKPTTKIIDYITDYFTATHASDEEIIEELGKLVRWCDDSIKALKEEL